MANDVSDSARAAGELATKIRTLLAGNSPEVVGGALAELLAIFIAGHHPGLRNEVMDAHTKCVNTLVPVVAEEMFGKQWPV